MPATQDDPFLSQDKSSHPGDYRDRSLSLLLRLLVVMIVACFIYTIIRAVERSFPGWEGLYLVGFCAFVGLEAIWMRRITAQIEFPDKAWIAIHVSEFVILLLLLKVVTYLVDGSQRFAQDVDAWKTNFVSSFFSGELIVAGGLGLLAWGLHMLFFKFLDELEVSELDQLRDGLASVERSKARAAILNNYLALGGVMVIITTLQQLATRYHWWNQAVQLGWDIISVLIYFILGLVLQAMIQYLHVRDRWMVEGGIVPDRIKARWMGYTLGLVLAVGIIAYLLPTRYSLGGLASLKMLFGVLFNFLGTLLVVFIYPLAYIWQLLLKALSANPPTHTLQAPVFPPKPIIETPESPLLWFEALKSFAFWMIVITLVVLSFYTYIRTHKEWFTGLRKYSILQALVRVWEGILGWWRKLRRGVSQAVQISRLSVQKGRPGLPTPDDGRFLNLRRLPARQRVIIYYLALVRRANECGITRPVYQTPAQYSRNLLETLSAQGGSGVQYINDVSTPITQLTDEFIEVRYSNHEVKEAQASTARRYWQQISRVLRRNKRLSS